MSSGAGSSSNYSTPYSVPIDAPVTSLSISPTADAAVLAARKGLFIIDLNSPHAAPRVIQHLTKWEVTDVIWNPHMSRINWIASTSNLKVLIWNINPAGDSMPARTLVPTTASSSGGKIIEHVLTSHLRAVSDLHWSPFEPEMLATCSYDSYVHLWDLRVGEGGGGVGVLKPTTSFCSWTGGATAVKWSRLSPWTLASSHDTGLKIWDTRKGSTPVTSITAHMTKIYGIDWSPKDENEIITCGQDQTIKFWNILDPRNCKGTIHTSAPVWRARFTPFGSGVLTMPQRKSHDLTLWSTSNLNEPVHAFKGHTDVVRDFVWRITQEENPDDMKFQLVSWGKDQTLRMWPVDPEISSLVGHTGRDYAGRRTVSGQTGSGGGAFSSSVQSSSTDSPYGSPVGSEPEITLLAGLQQYSESPIPTAIPNMAATSTTAVQSVSRGSPNSSGWKRVRYKRRKGGMFATNSDEDDEDYDDNNGSERRDFVAPLAGDDDDDGTGGVGGNEDDQSTLNSRIFRGGMAGLIGAIRRKFPSVVMERVDVPHFSITIGFQRSLDVSGGSPNDPKNIRDAYIRLTISWPLLENGSNDQPTVASTVPIYEIAKTGMLSMAQRNYLNSKLASINFIHSQRGESSVVPCLKFLVYGESFVVGSEDSGKNFGGGNGSGAMNATAGPTRSSSSIGIFASDNEALRSLTSVTDAPQYLTGSLESRSHDISSSSGDDYGLVSTAAGNVVSRKMSEQRLGKETAALITSGGDHRNDSIPFPRMCGASFGANGKLVYFFSKLPHPYAIKFSTFQISSRNQQPILQQQYFTAQPRTYSDYERFRKFLIQKNPKLVQFTLDQQKFDRDNGRLGNEFGGGSGAGSNQSLTETLMGVKLDHWFGDDDDDDQESILFHPPTIGSFQQQSDILTRIQPSHRPIPRSQPNRSASIGIEQHPSSAPVSPIISFNSGPLRSKVAAAPAPLSASVDLGSGTWNASTGSGLDGFKSAESSVVNSADEIWTTPVGSVVSLRRGSTARSSLSESHGHRRTRSFGDNNNISSSGNSSSSSSISQAAVSAVSGGDGDLTAKNSAPIDVNDAAVEPEMSTTATSSDDKKTSLSTSNADRLKATVEIRDVQFILPISKELAKKYTLRGSDPVSVCMLNSKAAKDFGRGDIARIWTVVSILIAKTEYDDDEVSAHRQVPAAKGVMQSRPSSRRRDSTNDEEERAASNFSRDRVEVHHDGTFDLAKVAVSQECYRTDWNSNPFGLQLINSIFNSLERAGDIQTIAMICCVLSEPFDGVVADPEAEPLTYDKLAAYLQLKQKQHIPATGLKSSMRHRDTIHHSLAHLPLAESYVSGSTMGSLMDSNASTAGVGSYSSTSQVPVSIGGMNSHHARVGPPSQNSHRFSSSHSPTSHMSRFSFLEGRDAPSPNIPMGKPLERIGGKFQRPLTGGSAVNLQSLVHNQNRASLSLNPSSPHLPTEISRAANGAAGRSQGGALARKESKSLDDCLIGANGHSSQYQNQQSSITGSWIPAQQRAKFKPSASILDPSKRHVYDRYILAYADALMAWDMGIERSEVLAFLGIWAVAGIGPPRNVRLDIEITKCGKCDGTDFSVDPPHACLSCHTSTRMVWCAVCRLPCRKGLYTICVKCGHGGHAQHVADWFAMGNVECPKSCSCNCMAPADCDGTPMM